MLKIVVGVFVIFLLSGLASAVFADVELMVQGQEYWQDGKPTVDWTRADFIDFWKQTHKGEIISILEGGSPFGRLDIPPAIIHITVTGVTVEQARQYLESVDTIAADSTVTVKERRWYFERRVIDSALTLWESDGSRLIITKSQAQNLLKEYDLVVIKQKIIDRLQR